MAHVRIQREEFDTAAEAAALTRGRKDIGAVVTFTGLCRDEGGALQALELEHYPGMAEVELARMDRPRSGRTLVAARRHRHSSLRQDRARRTDRFGHYCVSASRGGFRGRRFPDGLFEDQRAVLEEGTFAGRLVARLDCCERRGRRGCEALVAIIL
jgi:hypothetical protein